MKITTTHKEETQKKGWQRVEKEELALKRKGYIQLKTGIKSMWCFPAEQLEGIERTARVRSLNSSGRGALKLKDRKVLETENKQWQQ